MCHFMRGYTKPWCMVTDTGGTTRSALSPDEVFSVLGNETHLEILRGLGGAD